MALGAFGPDEALGTTLSGWTEITAGAGVAARSSLALVTLRTAGSIGTALTLRSRRAHQIVIGPNPLAGRVDDLLATHGHAGGGDVLVAHVSCVGRHGRPLSAQGAADGHARRHLDIVAHLRTEEESPLSG